MSAVHNSLFDAPGAYEYGVLYRGAEDAPHRWGMTEAEAREWITEWAEMGGNPDVVSLIRRSVGQWEAAA